MFPMFPHEMDMYMLVPTKNDALSVDDDLCSETTVTSASSQ